MIAPRWRRTKPSGGAESKGRPSFSITTLSPAFERSHCIDAPGWAFIVTATTHSNSLSGPNADLSHAKRHLTLTRHNVGSFPTGSMRRSVVALRFSRPGSLDTRRGL